MIYLDNAATSYYKPQEVAEAVFSALRQGMGNDGRGVHEGALAASSAIFQTRRKLARFFGAESPEQVVFTSNATEALNIAILGGIEEGSHIISTDFEHNSVLRPLYFLEKTRSCRLDFIPADERGLLDYSCLPKFLTGKTKALVVNHASNVTGNVADLALFGRFAKEHNLLFIVDASQTAGTFPLQMDDYAIDVLCFTGHKGLYGPMGTGGLCVRRGIDLAPLKFGGSGVQSYNKNHPPEMPTRLEAGTLNAHGIIGLGAALDWLAGQGPEKVHEKELALMRYFYESLVDDPGITIYGDFSSEKRAPIVSLNLGEEDAASVSDILSFNYHIATRPGAHCAPRMHQALGTEDRGAVRFSFSYFNTKEEVEAAVCAVKELAEAL